jgi:deazaflavin-dependent oxidoreductase (nitroreductase family)
VSHRPSTGTSPQAQITRHKRNPFTSSPTGGRVLSALHLPFFAARPPAGFGVLTTTGRRTGKTRRKCVHAIRHANKAYIVMLRPTPDTLATKRVSAWVLNIRANPCVRLRLPGGTFAGVARELTDTAEIAEARRIYCEASNLFDYAECAFHLSGRPTRAKIEQLHRSWFDTGIPIVVELEA